MADAKSSTEKAFIDLINSYPSPHNGQPMMLRRRDGTENTFDIFFDTSRGLTATEISYLFSFVTIGVFFRHIELCAKALGHTLQITTDLPPVSDMAAQGILKCGALTVSYTTHQPDNTVLKALLGRHTSRKKYTKKLSETEQARITLMASKHTMQAFFVNEKTAREVIWLNQRAVFDDMFDPAVRKELQHWLRFSSEEKQAKRDGLSYDCMELSGSALHFFVKRYRMLRWPVVSQLLKNYYLRTMRDISSVGYLLAPFSTEKHAFEIGQFVSDAWEAISEQGHYLHPFGTIVSNKEAHADFARLVGLKNESREGKYVVFIFRAGSSPEPTPSLRLEPEHHLLQEGN